MNYNTEQSLWNNYYKFELTKPNGGARLQVSYGMVSNGYEVLARFSTDADAEKVLRQAGYTEVKRHQWKASPFPFDIEPSRRGTL